MARFDLLREDLMGCLVLAVGNDFIGQLGVIGEAAGQRRSAYSPAWGVDDAGRERCSILADRLRMAEEEQERGR